MNTFIISLLSVSVISSVITALFPESEIRKPLDFLCKTVIAVSVFSIASSLVFEIPALPDFNENDYSDVFARVVEETVENTFSDIADEKLTVKYENGEIISDLSEEKIEKIIQNSSDIISEKGE